ncbi:DUF2786 domain-containing protein [Corynebacterium poyangense]|uniref:DUF2786 domain-containing protein n=1 Tax=Corynebacterium poyangense TaxID=2684405 RepID=A0A7H0SPY7_9CORY|nr:DUF2786 domain-containing protein [Corynebacterium poyangense]MBZ8178462.1 DUF2786 domain-containing protein [Corynebacterium poyangense]QNQ90612.1 DUF2786 domain-containing protein [Corynebacterium poyangense]
MSNKNNQNTTNNTSGEGLIIEAIYRTGSLGWTPTDLLHIFGYEIAYYLNRIDGKRVPSPMAQHWNHQLRQLLLTPHSWNPSKNVAQLCSQILRLPEIPGAELLYDPTLYPETDPQSLSGNTESQRQRSKVSKLLAKAESTTFPAEAESLILKAQHLQQLYRMCTLELRCSVTNPQPDIVIQRVYLKPPWVKHQHLLLNSVARHNSCRSLLIHPKGIACLFGSSEDIAQVVDLFSCLNNLRDYFMRNSHEARRRHTPGETNSFRRSFSIAFAYRIHELLTQASQQAIDDGPWRKDSLILLRKQDQQVVDKVSEIFPHTRQIQLSGHNFKGYQAGREAADISYRRRFLNQIDHAA